MQDRREQLYNDLLVLRCQEGDAAAFDELVGRWQAPLWRHARRLIGDEDAAWDALQEALLAIGRGIGTLADAAAFPAWAYRIVSNKCRDRQRRESRSRKATESFAENLMGKDAELQHEHARCADLRLALARLSGEERALLALHYEEGFAIEAISEILDIPAGTVKSRMHHLRQRLKAMMEDNDHEQLRS